MIGALYYGMWWFTDEHNEFNDRSWKGLIGSYDSQIADYYAVLVNESMTWHVTLSHRRALRQDSHVTWTCDGDLQKFRSCRVCLENAWLEFRRIALFKSSICSARTKRQSPTVGLKLSLAVHLEETSQTKKFSFAVKSISYKLQSSRTRLTSRQIISYKDY